jgi:hypothetical protein
MYSIECMCHVLGRIMFKVINRTWRLERKHWNEQGIQIVAVSLSLWLAAWQSATSQQPVSNCLSGRHQVLRELCLTSVATSALSVKVMAVRGERGRYTGLGKG